CRGPRPLPPVHARAAQRLGLGRRFVLGPRTGGKGERDGGGHSAHGHLLSSTFGQTPHLRTDCSRVGGVRGARRTLARYQSQRPGDSAGEPGRPEPNVAWILLVLGLLTVVGKIIAHLVYERSQE